jgi:hypothetical protein
MATVIPILKCATGMAAEVEPYGCEDLHPFAFLVLRREDAAAGRSRLPIVTSIQSFLRYRKVNGVPHAGQKSRHAAEELWNMAGWPRVHAKSCSLSGTKAANGPPTAFWHMRQWQRCAPSGAA